MQLVLAHKPLWKPETTPAFLSKGSHKSLKGLQCTFSPGALKHLYAWIRMLPGVITAFHLAPWVYISQAGSREAGSGAGEAGGSYCCMWEKQMF